MKAMLQPPLDCDTKQRLGWLGIDWALACGGQTCSALKLLSGCGMGAGRGAEEGREAEGQGGCVLRSSQSVGRAPHRRCRRRGHSVLASHNSVNMLLLYIAGISECAIAVLRMRLAATGSTVWLGFKDAAPR